MGRLVDLGTWPDNDANDNLKAVSRELEGVRAVALGYETDWDLVRIVPVGTDPAKGFLLGPGRVVHLPARTKFDVFPAVTAPQTRNGDLLPEWAGKLQLEVWEEGECPPHHRPQLAAVRFLELTDLAVTGRTGVVDQGLLTVPAINVERAEFRLRNTSRATEGDPTHATLFVQLVQPLADDALNDADGVSDSDAVEVDPDDEHSLFIEEPSGPYLKIAVGCDDHPGGAISGVLALVRRRS